MVALAPDVILAHGSDRAGTIAAGDPHRADRVPDCADPVAAGFVDSLASPGGNATGFIHFEYSSAGNGWNCSRRVTPDVTRVAVLREPGLTAAIAQFATIQAVAPSLQGGGHPTQLSVTQTISSGRSHRLPALRMTD